MADTHVTNHALDVILKLEAEQLATALSSYFGLAIPPIVRPFPTDIPRLDLRTERLDNVFELADTDLLHLEYQSEYRAEVLLRFLSYDLGLYQQHRRRIRTVVIYGPGVTTAAAEINAGAIRYTVENIFLGERDGEATYTRLQERVRRGQPLDEHDRLDLVFLPLMARRRPLEEVVSGSLQLARNLPEEQQQRAAGALLGLAYHYIGKNAFERLLESIMATNYEVLDRFLTRWMDQQREQWERQASVQSKRDAIVTVLTSRFGAPTPDVTERLAYIDDLTRLDELLAFASSAASLDEVIRMLDTLDLTR